MAKSQFLYLAYQSQVGGATGHGHLEVVKIEARHLHEELEASQRLRDESSH
jgi:hypothetical protein